MLPFQGFDGLWLSSQGGGKLAALACLALGYRI
jgi:hypothetical protein